MLGKFIVFEGIDGCGKTTQMLKTSDYLFREFKNPILLTHEPSCSKYGLMVKRFLRTQKNPFIKAEECLNLYVLDRKIHLKNLIIPNLKQGVTILCDRFFYSSLAFQKAQGIEFNKILRKHSKILKPDLVLLFDLPTGLAIKRIVGKRLKQNSACSLEKFEQQDFLENVRQNYLQLTTLLRNHNIKIIDASKSIQKVWLQVKKEIDFIFEC